MRRITLTLVTVLVTFVSVAKLSALPRSPDPHEFTQPNGYTFTAKEFGDEFYWRVEMTDGYTILFNRRDGYWYYAKQSVDGYLAPTLLKVGDGDPAGLGLSRHIDYSAAKKDAMLQQAYEFNAALQPKSVSGPISLGVILIQFADWETNEDARGGIGYYGQYYTTADFDNLFFSTGTYNNESPDGELVYGSLNDYYKEVSYSQVSIVGAILNDVEDGKYIWYTAAHEKDYYTGAGLIQEAIDSATAHGYNPSSYDVICVLYAGERRGGALWPHYTDSGYIMSEKWDEGKFAHIGPHAHEFGHSLGLSDKYEPYGDVGYWGLMGQGCYNGPNEGACPAHLNAVSKSEVGWLTLQTVQSNFKATILNVEDNAVAYRFAIGTGQYFAVETRMKTKFDRFLPWDTQSLGLLIWHHGFPYSHEDLEEADGDENEDGGDMFPGSKPNHEFSALTNPSSNDAKGGATGIAIKNILRPGSVITADFIINEWVGEIRSNKTWSNTINVIGDIVVWGGEGPEPPVSTRLDISPGTIVRFAALSDAKNAGQDASRCELIVKGILVAQGTVSNPIKFTSSAGAPEPDDWSGIVFTNLADDITSVIANSIIEYAYTGIYLDGSEPPVKSNTIRRNFFGIRAYNSYTSDYEIDFRSNYLYENDFSGIYLYNSSPTLYSNVVKSSIFGLQLCNCSSPVLSQSTISNNTKDGIICSGSSSPQVYFNSTYDLGGCNTITNNGRDGVRAYSYCYPNLGFGSDYPGLNSIYNNMSYEVYNGNSDVSIYAQYNWWGSSNGPSPGDFYGSVVYDPYLTSPPIPPDNLASGNPDSINDFEHYNSLGTEYEMQELFKEAIAAYEYIIYNYPDFEEAKYALIHIIYCYQKLGLEDQIVSYLENIANEHLNKDLEQFALGLSVSFLERSSEYHKALDRAMSVRMKYNNEEIRKNLLFHMANIYQHGLQDREKARELFRELLTTYPEDDLALIAQAELILLERSSSKGGTQTAGEGTIPSLSSTAFSIFPNPSSTSFNIRYALSKSDLVILNIYDLTGRIVKNLVHAEMEAGYHLANWHVKGSPSGIYFAKLQVGEFTQTRKLVLMK